MIGIKLQDMKTQILTFFFVIFAAIAGWLFVPSGVVLADDCGAPAGTPEYNACHRSAGQITICADDEIQTSINLTGSTCVKKDSGGDIGNNPIIKLIATIVRFLSVGVGIAVTISIVIAGIQYISSQGNPQTLQAAQGRLTNAIIALVLFIFMTTIINFLIPGGVF